MSLQRFARTPLTRGSAGRRISGIVGTIHASFASTRVIVMGMLPRGTDYWDSGSSKTAWPNALTPAIDALNAELQVRAGGRPAPILALPASRPTSTCEPPGMCITAA